MKDIVDPVTRVYLRYVDDDSPPLEELYLQGKNGYLSDSRESAVFADFCSQLIKNKTLYEEIARENHNKARKLFVTEVVKEKLLNIYKELN